MTAPKERKLVFIAGFAAGLLLLLVLVLTLWPRPNTPQSDVGSDRPLNRLSVNRPPPRTVRPTAPQPPAPIEPGKPLPPVIDEIVLEKEEVCEGEENLVTVRAHTLDGADPLLHYVIGSERGMSVPLKTYLDSYGQPLHQYITVFGNRNVSTRVEVPSY